MSIIKETIKFNNQDVNLKISLSGGNRFTGYQQEIDSFVEETKENLINPVVDNEVRRFHYASKETLSPINLVFYFTANGSSYGNSFQYYVGFTASELTLNDLKVLNSFFVLEFYDTYDNNTQTKIFTNYLTKILGGDKIGGNPIPKYRIYGDTVNQFYNWYIPKSFLDKQTSSTVTGYVKFSFFNAKYGTMALFYNKDISNQYTPERLYFKTRLDLNKMTWKFDYNGTNYPPNAVAYQLPFTNKYSEKVNNGINNFNNKQQNPPSGNTFQILDGTYTIV